MNRNFYLKTQKENQNNHTEKSNSYFRPRQPSLTQKKVQVNCREAAIKHTSSLCLYGVVKIGGLLYWLTWSMKGGPWTNSISVLMDLVHSTLPGTSLVWCPTHFLPSVFYPFPDTNLILYLSGFFDQIQICLHDFPVFTYLFAAHHAYVAHRAAIKSFQRCLSLASFSLVLHLSLSSLGPFSTVLHQVVFGCPLLCLPSGIQCSAILAMFAVF